MSDYNKNVYYYPQASGLETVAEIEYSDGFYQFDTRVVWVDKSGRFWTARDSGGSCPNPFEDLSLELLDRLNISELEREVRAELATGYANITPEQGQTFIKTIRDAKVSRRAVAQPPAAPGGEAG